MGNAFDSDTGKMNSKTPHEEESYLTTAEKNVLQQVYVKIRPDKSVSREAIVEVFGDAERLVFSECVLVWAQKDITLVRFEKLVIQICRMDASTTIKTIWSLLADLSKTNRENKIVLFFVIVLVLALPDDFFVNNDDGSKLLAVSSYANCLVEYFTNCMKKQDPSFDIGNVTNVTLCGWINNFVPHIPKVIESYVSRRCFKDILSPSFKPFLAPILVSASSAYTNGSILTELELLPLALANPNLQDVWQRLYSSAVDGSSFNRIVHHILGYDGPTCIIIKCADAEHTVLGCYCADRWKEHNKFYGSSSNMLFTLTPRIRMYRPKAGGNGNYQYLNTTGYSLPHGLGLGGTVEGFRFFIPESLESCTAGGTCPTFEPGRLVEGGKFEIDSIEIWGCGGSEKVSHALKAQLKDRESTNEAIQRARKVDRGQFFGNKFDQEFFLNKTLQHRQEQADREGCDVDYDSNNVVYKGNINMS